MKDIYLQTFQDDVEKIYKTLLTNDKKTLNNHINNKTDLFDRFWNSLNKNQKTLYESFDKELSNEQLLMEESIYVFALKKGMAIGYDVAKSFLSKD